MRPNSRAWAGLVALVLVAGAGGMASAQGKGNGGGGGGGGGGDIPDIGDLYGDLYVILRDVNGVPILSEDGCIQPISAVTETTSIQTSEGEVTISVTEGEPFALPTYYDIAGDLVECELTEDMADWVQGVDFGRLNLGRAPESVIAHAFDEAVNQMNAATAIAIDPAGRLILTLPDAETEGSVDKTIDAPAENLALYVKMMTDGHWITEDAAPDKKGGPPAGKGPPEGDGPSTEPRPVLNATAIGLLSGLGFSSLGSTDSTTGDLDSHHLILAASLLAAAADKTASITLDQVVYINSLYGINRVGSLPGEVEGKTYFDFGGFAYGNGGPGRNGVYSHRRGGTCTDGAIWVLQPDDAEYIGFTALCMDILGYENSVPGYENSVHFTHMAEGYSTYPADCEETVTCLSYDFISNVRGFAQAADDALRVVEYIHNYKVPEVLYPSEVLALRRHLRDEKN